MSVSVSDANPAYTLKSVLTAQLNPVPVRGETAPVSHNGSESTKPASTPPPPTPPPTNLAAHGVGGSVNHQG